MKVETILKGWNEFFFKPQSPLPFAVFRILYGLLILQILLVQLWPDRMFWYGADGVLDTQAVLRFFWQQPVFDLFNITGDGAGGVTLIFCVSVLAALFVTIGLGTRYSAWLLFMCLATLHMHNPTNLNGGDCFLRITAFYLALSNAGEALSVDRLLKRKFAPESLKEECWPWAQRLFQIQVALVYWQTSVAKLSGEQWINGTAVWSAVRLEDMYRLPIPFIFDNLLVCQLLTWGTLIIEVSLWTLIWVKELRYWVLLAGLALHLGIDLAISLPIFEWAFICAYVTFIDPQDLKNFFVQVREWSKVKISVSRRLAAQVASGSFGSARRGG
jgi:uncharacterized membrane protein YphA (DoxX/SURF4 family)